ncbi:MAG: MFS transporter [Aliidongia sp.]
MSDFARPIPRRRWGIGALLGAGVLINYIDRLNLSVAAPQLQAEFNIDPGDMGLLFSALFWSYAYLQIPVGMVLDRFGVMQVGRIGAFLWAVTSGVMAFTSGFTGIFAARFVLGIAEAPGFPASSKATAIGFRAASARWQRPSSTLPPNSPTSSACRWSRSSSAISAGAGASA